MPDIYVVVADSSQARILYASGKTEPLGEHALLEHPEGRAHVRDLTSDLPGHGSNHVGAGKHAMDQATDPKQNEQLGFAKELAKYLDSLQQNNNIDQLMIIAPPAFLGMLREQISDSVSRQVSLELDKNLTQHKLDDLRTFIPYFKPVERVMT